MLLGPPQDMPRPGVPGASSGPEALEMGGEAREQLAEIYVGSPDPRPAPPEHAQGLLESPRCGLRPAAPRGASEVHRAGSGGGIFPSRVSARAERY